MDSLSATIQLKSKTALPITQQRSTANKAQLVLSPKRQKHRVSSLGDVHVIVSKFELEYHAAEKQIQVLDKIMVDKTKQLTELVKQTIEQGTENGILSAVIEERKSKNEDMAKFICSAGERSDQLENEKRAFETKIEEVKEDVQSLMKNAAATELKSRIAEQYLTELDDLIGRKEMQLTCSMERLAMLNEDCFLQTYLTKESEIQFQEVNLVNASLKNSFQSLEEDCLVKQQARCFLENELQVLQKELLSLEEKIQTMNELQTMKINDHESHFLEHLFKLESVEAVVASLKMETELAISEESKAKEEFHSKEIQQAESAEALQNKKSELEKLQNDVMEADLLIVSIGHECETKNEQMNQQEMAIRDFEGQIENILLGNQLYLKNISQLQTAVDILATEVNELKLKHNDLKRTDETNEDELSLKEKELEEMLEQSVHNQTLLQKEEMQLNEQIQKFQDSLKEGEDALQQLFDLQGLTMLEHQMLQEQQKMMGEELAIHKYNHNLLEQTNEARLYECRERKAKSLEEIFQLQISLDCQHLEMKELQTRFMSAPAELLDEDMIIVEGSFLKRKSEIESQLDSKYQQQLLTLSNTLQRIKNEADVRVIQQQDSSHERQLQQAAKLHKVTEEFQQLENEYNTLIEQQQREIEEQLNQQRKEAEKLKKSFENERQKKHAETEELRRAFEEEKMRKEEETKQLQLKFQEDFTRRLLDSERIKAELEENKRMQAEEAESLKLRLEEEKQKLEQASEVLKRNHEQEILKQMSDREMMLQKYKEDLLLQQQKSEEERIRQVMAESEALKKRHEEELSKQKEELERLLKLHEEEKKAQEKLIADFEAKQLEQKNKESIQATQEMLPCQEDAPNDSLNNQQCELIDPLSKSDVQNIFIRPIPETEQNPQVKTDQTLHINFEDGDLDPSIVASCDDFGGTTMNINGDNLEQIETAYNNCPPGLESVIPMTCIEPEIRVAEEMMQASSAHENTASQPMKSLHIAHSDSIDIAEKKTASLKTPKKRSAQGTPKSSGTREKKTVAATKATKKNEPAESSNLAPVASTEKSAPKTPKQQGISSKDISNSLTRTHAEHQMPIHVSDTVLINDDGIASKTPKRRGSKDQMTSSANKSPVEGSILNPKTPHRFRADIDAANESKALKSTESWNHSSRSTTKLIEKEKVINPKTPKGRGSTSTCPNDDSDLDIEQYLKEKRNSALRKKQTSSAQKMEMFSNMSSAPRAYGARVKTTQEAKLPEVRGSPNFLNQVLTQDGSEESDMLFASQQSQQLKTPSHQFFLKPHAPKETVTKKDDHRNIQKRSSSFTETQVRESSTVLENNKQVKVAAHTPSRTAQESAKKNALSMTVDVQKRTKPSFLSAVREKFNLNSIRQAEKQKTLESNEEDEAESKLLKRKPSQARKNKTGSAIDSIFSSTKNSGNVDWFADDAFAF